MCAGQGSPGPSEICEERLEKNAEGDMGADPCRLDSKAGGCNDIAVKKDWFFHRTKTSSFRNVKNKPGP